jgi:hypothetical protein
MKITYKYVLCVALAAGAYFATVAVRGFAQMTAPFTEFTVTNTTVQYDVNGANPRSSVTLFAQRANGDTASAYYVGPNGSLSGIEVINLASARLTSYLPTMNMKHESPLSAGSVSYRQHPTADCSAYITDGGSCVGGGTINGIAVMKVTKLTNNLERTLYVAPSLNFYPLHQEVRLNGVLTQTVTETSLTMGTPDAKWFNEHPELPNTDVQTFAAANLSVEGVTNPSPSELNAAVARIRAKEARALATNRPKQ